MDIKLDFEDQENVQMFFDLWIWYTGNPDDCLSIESVHRKYLAECQNEPGALSCFNFTRYVRKLFPDIGYVQKKLDGRPYHVFCGVKFQE